MLALSITLRTPIDLASIRDQFIERRDKGAKAALETEVFAGKFEVQGKTALVNGRSYAVQLNKSGQRRIKLGKAWLPLDTLKAFCEWTKG